MQKYKRIRIGKRRSNRTRDRHRLIMENHLGRKLSFNEVVDHINGNPKDDRLSNLRLMTRSEHAKMHYENGDYSLNTKKTIKKLKDLGLKRRLPYTEDKLTCCRCKQLKPIEDFYRNKKRWCGRNSYCKKCHVEVNRINNKEV